MEIIIAMVILGLVATGIMNAFAFSRRLTHRSRSELASMGMVEEISEQLRTAVGVVQGTPPNELPDTLPNGLTLRPGVYVDRNMLVTARPLGAVTLPNPNPEDLPDPLRLPDDFQRFLTNQGRTPAANWRDHADGRVLVVEDAPVDNNPANGRIDKEELDVVDLDGDGLAGIDFNNDGVTDMRRVRVKVRFSTAEPLPPPKK